MFFTSSFHRSQWPRTRRRANQRHAVRRARFEALEDRLTPSFAYWGALPQVEFDQMTGPDVEIAYDSATGILQLNSADFNADGWNDLFRVTLSDPGYPHLGEINQSRSDGTLDAPHEFNPGPDPRWIATGDFAVGGFDGGADFAIYNYYGFGDQGEFGGVIIDAWHVYRNMGNWPVVGSELPGDFNHNGTVDAADYVVWRKTLGTSMPNYSGADGNGNGVVDEGDHAMWRANFGQTLPMVGAGSLVAAATAPHTAPAQPDERGSIEPPGTSARDAAIAVLDSQLPASSCQGRPRCGNSMFCRPANPA